MNALLIDTSFLYALYNPDDSYHTDAIRFRFTRNTFRSVKIIIPLVILPEAGHLFLRDAGHQGLIQFLHNISTLGIPPEPSPLEDLQRAHQIMQAYSSAKFDLVDCCLMALAERLDIRHICTYDRRDFSIFRPRHCPYLELLP
jgi:predicted nucleic acid-binding protein